MEHVEEILAALKDPARLVRLTFSGPRDPHSVLWQRITVRPVEIGGARMLQAVRQGQRKEESFNFAPTEAAARLDDFLAMQFEHMDLQCADGDLHVRITRKGKALVSRGAPSAPGAPPARHDREKRYAFPADAQDPFLERMGILHRGFVVGAMQDKFRQINHFLELLGHTRLFRDPPRDGIIRLVDCGCGKAFLTFAAYHYLKDLKGVAVSVTGVDANAEVIERAEEMRERLGLHEVRLVRSRFWDYEPPEPVNVVFSLHACDTATDEAIAQGVKWGADLIVCAPCCQHELHQRIVRPEFRAVLRHGILRERLADTLTDALRAAALRVAGYQAEVIEFIDPEHTAKNLMIRAERAPNLPRVDAAAEYLRLRDFWRVQPSIEMLLEDEMEEWLAGASPGEAAPGKAGA